MQTRFTSEQSRDPVIRQADAILRKCVHCGFCTATCPTYVLRGDELDSPRGRIYLIKGMHEEGGSVSAAAVKHIDRCLGCLSCMTTCPSGVDYMHLVDAARLRIEAAGGARPWHQQALRLLVGRLTTSRRWFRLGLRLGALARPWRRLLPSALRPLLALVPDRLPAPSPSLRAQEFPAEGPRRHRVALLTGCVQAVLDRQILESTIRLLTRHGCAVVVAEGAGCCGALTHHLGQEAHARGKAAAAIEAWWRLTAEGGGDGLDAVVINTSGCGTTIKDYGRMFAGTALAAKAETIAGLARDVSEWMAGLGPLAPVIATGQRVAYHSPCSLQHGQRVRDQPRNLLKQAGFTLLEVPEGHLCCGSAGVYNLLQPDLAGRLRDRKLAHIDGLQPELIATGNLGCMIQLGSGTGIPVVHTVQLLDWATGGPRPWQSTV
ncbi:MAG TPA: glycolate oxidase subunit GlcF [Rhodospirillaceae bacterium]|nr:glycolate oxidase subunit GlcF [Rhodospirillaceae bacterium]